MVTELSRLTPQTIGTVLAGWLGVKAPTTQAKYAKCLGFFADFLRADSTAEALTSLLAAGRGDANALVGAYKASMMQKKLSSSTANLRLASIKSFVDEARRCGKIDWSLDVPGVKSEPRRDASGPTAAVYESMLAATGSARDRLVLLLGGDRGLRRSEIAALDFDDFTGDGLLVLGKGRREKERVSLNARTTLAVMLWITERGREPGKLIGVSERSVRAIVEKAGARVGYDAHVHGLRHRAITAALDATDGDVRKVQRFARHGRAETTIRYDDKRQSHEREVAMMVGGA